MIADLASHVAASTAARGMPVGGEAGEQVEATGGREAHFDDALCCADLEIALDRTTRRTDRTHKGSGAVNGKEFRLTPFSVWPGHRRQTPERAAGREKRDVAT
jgi:hypothetical protein